MNKNNLFNLFSNENSYANPSTISYSTAYAVTYENEYIAQKHTTQN